MAYVNNILNFLKLSYRKMIECPLRTLMIIAIDFITFIVFALVAGSFQNKIMDHLIAINNIVTSRLSGIGEASVGQVSEALGMISVDAFMEHYKAFLLLLALMFLCSTMIYILFQHINWIKSFKLIANEKINWKPYLARFAAIAGLWVIIFVGAMYSYIRLTLTSSAFSGSAYGNATKWFVIIIFLLGFYFTFAGYSMAHKHMLPTLLWTHVVKGIKKIHYLLPFFLLFLIKAYVIFHLMDYIFPISVHISVPLTVILVMPLFTWLRFGFIIAGGEAKPSTKRKKKKKHAHTRITVKKARRNKQDNDIKIL